MMRPQKWHVGGLLLAILTAGAFQVASADPLAELSDRLDRLDRALTRQSQIRNPEYRADNAELAKITLPDLKNRTAVKNYIASILDLSYGQRRVNVTDPQVEKLAAVGRDNLDLLLAALEPESDGNARVQRFTSQQFSSIIVSQVQFINGRYAGNFYLTAAIAQLADDRDQALILAALEKHPCLLWIVPQKKWQNAVIPQLLRQLKKRSISQNWLALATDTQNSRLLAALTDYFVQCGNWSNVYALLSPNPHWDREKAIQRAWRWQQLTQQYYDVFIPGLMAAQGDQKALDVLIERAERNRSRQSKKMLAECIDIGNSGLDPVNWYRRNKSRVYWDAAMKKFRAADMK